ncbi:MAG: hypothetical protein JRG96_19415 [Deltaproteobacteria bacterium]|nr:hypothetical protein [Deltaproteobacteria bacterium]MBW2422005.1 hypothetical protein [Deltaproteobacteria bacterium]
MIGSVALRSCALAGLILVLASAASAGGDPMNLSDRRPRWVGVTFEVSSSDDPGRINTRYSDSFAAWLRPGETEDLIEVVVPSSVVEEHLLVEESPMPGSFSDFVWVFDARGGEVVSASVSGVMLRTLDWGLAKTRAAARIQVDMGTRARAGFEAPRTLLGQTFFRHCTRRNSASCTLVDGVPLDPSSGYVNAVGAMQVRSSVTTLRSFSPLGEAIFQEVAEPELAVAASAERPQPHDLQALDLQAQDAAAAAQMAILEIN